jgi:peptidoglycan/LPS O-acetylase OafA/YrhL
MKPVKLARDQRQDGGDRASRAGHGHLLEYRADVDGLRAVAIVAVLLYHGGFGFAGGGYVGVDVFFVISGYLIASLVQAELAAGRFSVIGFYERRVRRLFPALFVMLATCSVVAALLFLPDELRRFGGSVLATSVFASNVFFWLETGYFQTAAEFKPLIHTWSLAVEEQFYLLVPLLLMPGIRRYPAVLRRWTIGILIVSLLAGEWTLRNWPSASFYLTPFRLWELATGVLLALHKPPERLSESMRSSAAWIGVALIVASVMVFSWQTPFPGLRALAPCAGTALLIWSGAGADTAIKRLLSRRPVVYLGLISYSLYLWHWPILSFARYWAVRELTAMETASLLAASVGLAALSWRFVEQPFRTKDGVLGRQSLFGAACVAIGAMCIFGLTAVASHGWPGRLDGESLRLASASGERNPRTDACSFLEADEVLRGRACRLGPAAAAPTFAVWGDSHADALMPAFDRLAERHGVAGLYLGRVGCPPLLGIERVGTSFHCNAFNEAARRAIAASGVRTVVLVARWAHFSSDPLYGREARVRVVISEPGDGSAHVQGNDGALRRGLERTLKSLSTYNVYVVTGIPEVGYDVPAVLARIRHLDRAFDIRPAAAAYRVRQQAVESMFDAEKSRFAFTLLRPSRRLCDNRLCEVESGGKPLYFDSHHLSVQGAALVADELEAAFTGTGGGP